MNRAAQAIGRKAGLSAQVADYKKQYEGASFGKAVSGAAQNMPSGTSSTPGASRPTDAPNGAKNDFASRPLPPGLKKKKKLPPPWQSGTFNPKGVKAYQQGLRGTRGKKPA